MEENDEIADGIKKVVLIGPECTGKTTLARSLAEYYGTTWVPEYAREYIDALSRPYSEEDLLSIAKGQLAIEDELALRANRVLICDTDLLVIKVWQEHRFGKCYPEIGEWIQSRYYDLYLLMHADIPWDDDPQRENPHLRDYFFDIFKKELKRKGANLMEINGDFSKRKHAAIMAIDDLLKNDQWVP